MKNRLYNFFLISLLMPFMANAQSVDNIMRSNGRIYVVIGVILIILFGLILYMIRIEKKVNKLRRRDDK